MNTIKMNLDWSYFEPNGVYSRDNLPNKIKKGTYVINLDEYENTGTHWVSFLYLLNQNIWFILIVLV